MRQRFLAAGAGLMPESLFLLAEKVMDDLVGQSQSGFVDLADLEKIITDIADVVILFCESPGSIAELGYFVAHKDIIPKIFFILDNKHANNESFINNRLVSKVNSLSTFRQAAILDFDADHMDFAFIPRRIGQRIPSVLKRRAFPKAKYNDLSFHDRFVLVQWVIYVLRRANSGQIAICLKSFCGDDAVEFRDVLAALTATGLIRRDGSGGLYETDKPPFLVFSTATTEDVRAVFAEFEEKVLSDAA
jgi:hypothetical protein